MIDRLSDRVVICGNSKVGKTAIFKRIKGEEFSDRYQSTQLVSYFSYHYPPKSSDDNNSVDVNIWDIGGNPKMRHLAKIYLENIELSIIVFDITDKSSFESIKAWTDLVRLKSPSSYFFLVANKCDFNNGESALSQNQIEESVETYKNSFRIGNGDNNNIKNSIKVFYTSAKSGEGISDLIKSTAMKCKEIREMRQRMITEQTNERKTQNTEDKEEDNSCCQIA